MKKVLISVCFILVIAGLYLVYQKSFVNYSLFFHTNQTNGKRITVYQKIIADGLKNKLSDKISVEEGFTALDLLKKTAQVETKGEGSNAFVVSINNIGAKESKKEYWAFYINDKPSTIGGGNYKLKSGDKIEWKIENY